MLQVYSINQALADGIAIPFNNVAIQKGKTAILGAPATIEINKKGIYEILVDGSIDATTTATTATIQLTKNGIPMPQAQKTVATDTVIPVSYSFSALVQATEDNTCCCITSPTTLQVVYTGDASTGDINVVVTKIC